MVSLPLLRATDVAVEAQVREQRHRGAVPRPLSQRRRHEVDERHRAAGRRVPPAVPSLGTNHAETAVARASSCSASCRSARPALQERAVAITDRHRRTERGARDELVRQRRARRPRDVEVELLRELL